MPYNGDSALEKSKFLFLALTFTNRKDRSYSNHLLQQQQQPNSAIIDASAAAGSLIDRSATNITINPTPNANRQSQLTTSIASVAGTTGYMASASSAANSHPNSNSKNNAESMVVANTFHTATPSNHSSHASVQVMSGVMNGAMGGAMGGVMYAPHPNSIILGSPSYVYAQQQPQPHPIQQQQYVMTPNGGMWLPSYVQVIPTIQSSQQQQQMQQMQQRRTSETSFSFHNTSASAAKSTYPKGQQTRDSNKK